MIFFSSFIYFMISIPIKRYIGNPTRTFKKVIEWDFMVNSTIKEFVVDGASWQHLTYITDLTWNVNA